MIQRGSRKALVLQAAAVGSLQLLSLLNLVNNLQQLVHSGFIRETYSSLPLNYKLRLLHPVQTVPPSQTDTQTRGHALQHRQKFIERCMQIKLMKNKQTRNAAQDLAAKICERFVLCVCVCVCVWEAFSFLSIFVGSAFQSETESRNKHKTIRKWDGNLEKNFQLSFFSLSPVSNLLSFSDIDIRIGYCKVAFI